MFFTELTQFCELRRFRMVLGGSLVFGFEKFGGRVLGRESPTNADKIDSKIGSSG